MTPGIEQRGGYRKQHCSFHIFCTETGNFTLKMDRASSTEKNYVGRSLQRGRLRIIAGVSSLNTKSTLMTKEDPSLPTLKAARFLEENIAFSNRARAFLAAGTARGRRRTWCATFSRHRSPPSTTSSSPSPGGRGASTTTSRGWPSHAHALTALRKNNAGGGGSGK